MICNFWKKQEEPALSNYDKMTEEYLAGDWKLAWQHQISGEKNFDSFDFYGFLGELAFDPNWRDAFKYLPNSKLFVERLNEFYNLKFGHFDQNDERDCNFSREIQIVKEETLLAAAAKLLELSIEIAKRSQQTELVTELENMVVKAAKEKEKEIEFDCNRRQIFNDLGDKQYSLYAICSDLYTDNRINDWSNTHNCLQEGCYALAADFYLVQWLMQDFHTLDFDITPYFDFFWKLQGAFYAEGNIIYVFQKESE